MSRVEGKTTVAQRSRPGLVGGIARRVLERALSLRSPGRYQLQAAIAALHVERETDWPQIAALYERLARLEPTPIVVSHHLEPRRPTRTSGTTSVAPVGESAE